MAFRAVTGPFYGVQFRGHEPILGAAKQPTQNTVFLLGGLAYLLFSLVKRDMLSLVSGYYTSFNWRSHICKIVMILPTYRGELMNNRNDRFKLDFMSVGQDIKRGREAKDVTREQLSEITGYAPRHIQAIENEGQTPSVDFLFQLAEMFDVSLDRHIFKDRDTVKSSIRRRVDTLLDGLADKDLVIVEAVIKGIHQASEMPEE